MGKIKPRIPTPELIRRLRLMHSAGGMLTKDRLEVILQASDRLEELDKNIDNTTEQSSRTPASTTNEARG